MVFPGLGELTWDEDRQIGQAPRPVVWTLTQLPYRLAEQEPQELVQRLILTLLSSDPAEGKPVMLSVFPLPRVGTAQNLEALYAAL